jgi:ribonuclease HIII
MLHEECASYLQPGKHVVDKYPGCSAGDLQEEKAESKYVEVAAASVLARDAALKQISSLSAMAGFRIPLGSTHVQLALIELRHRGLSFSKFVKLDFNNVKEMLKNEPLRPKGRSIS